MAHAWDAVIEEGAVVIRCDGLERVALTGRPSPNGAAAIAELLRAANLGERLLEHALPLRRVVELIEDVDDEEQAAIDLVFDITVYDRTKKRDVLVDVIRGG